MDAPHRVVPTTEQQHVARREQEAAEESFRPEDAHWAEQAVEQEAGKLFRAIFQRSAVGIALVDMEGRISMSNPSLERILGYGSGELVGRAFTDLACPEDAALDHGLFGELMRGERDHYTIEKRYVRKDGSLVCGQMTASVINGSDEVPQFVVGIVEDISERHRAEEAIRQRDRQIREAYAGVIEAVTGGKLVLVGPDEAEEELGCEVWRTEPITTPERLSAARRELRKAVVDRYGNTCEPEDFVLAAVEAMTNALKHAGKACVRLLEKDDLPQVEVTDPGPGIDFTHLPKATLTPGFSTATSLGMGFTIMLSACDRVLLSTTPSGTEVVLEARERQ